MSAPADTWVGPTTENRYAACSTVSMARRMLRAPDELPRSTVTPSESFRVRHLAFTLLSAAIVILLLRLMRSVLIPFFLGALLFYALDPPVDWLERWRVPRPLGAALMILVVMAACGGLAYSLQGQALEVIDQLPTGARRLAQ